jgi:hypothetical protein
MPISIDQLRKKMDEKRRLEVEAAEAKHRLGIEALEAFAGVQDYLDDDAIREAMTDGAPSSHAASNGKPRAPSGKGKGSNRDKVLAVIGVRWAGLKEIMEETGLGKKQVWGVVASQEWTAKIARRKTTNGVTEYHLKEEFSGEAK